MNSLMMPVAGFVYEPRAISEKEAREIFQKEKNNFKSYIGYPNACRVASSVLEHEFILSRDMTEVKAGDAMLVLKLRYRVDPGEKAGRKHGSCRDDYDWYYCPVLGENE